MPGGGQVARPLVLVPNAALPAATAVPNSATDAAAQPSSSSQIVLTWTDAALDENGYHIDRSTDGARWAQVASLPANSTSYMDTGLIQGMQYQYRILPFNVKGYAAAAQASAVTFGAPVAPTNCRIPAVNVSTTSLRVAWTNNSNTQTAVYVQYAKNSTFTGAMEVSAAGTATQLDLTGLTNNTTYYVRVRGVNAAGSSGYSNTASATTPRK